MPLPPPCRLVALSGTVQTWATLSPGCPGRDGSLATGAAVSGKGRWAPFSGLLLGWLSLRNGRPQAVPAPQGPTPLGPAHAVPSRGRSALARLGPCQARRPGAGSFRPSCRFGCSAAEGTEGRLTGGERI